MKIKIDIQKILNIVCEYYGFHIVPIKGRSRKDNLVKARQMYCYLAHEYSDCTYQQIGDLIERDHATVIFSVSKVQIQKEIYRNVSEEIEEITQKLLLPKCIVESCDLLKIAILNTKALNYLT